MRKGQSHSEETRKKISERMKGRPKSNDTKEKMSIKRSIWWAHRRQELKNQQENLLDEGPVRVEQNDYPA